MTSKLGNPGIFGLSTFGFALSLLGFQLVVNHEIAGATLYALIVAALGETLAGLYSIARGDGYLAGVLTTFGLWLIGYFLFHFSPLFSPESNALFLLMLTVPVAIMAVPAFRMRKAVLAGAFSALLLMLLSTGFGSYFAVEALETAGGVLAFVAAGLIYRLVYEEVDEATRPAPVQQPAREAVAA